MTTLDDFAELRPRLKALLQLHRVAQTDEARATLEELFEDVFLATAWHVARDLLDNGWRPGHASPTVQPATAVPAPRRLRLV